MTECISNLRGPTCGSKHRMNAFAETHWWQNLQGCRGQTASHACRYRAKEQRQHQKWHLFETTSAELELNSHVEVGVIPVNVCHNDCWVGQLLSYSCHSQYTIFNSQKVSVRGFWVRFPDESKCTIIFTDWVQLNLTFTRPPLQFLTIFSPHLLFSSCWTTKITTGVWSMCPPIHFQGCQLLWLSVTLPVSLYHCCNLVMTF